MDQPIENIFFKYSMQKNDNIQLFNPFDAVESATPLLLIDKGNTSLGSTQPMGPIEIPYAVVNMYIPL